MISFRYFWIFRWGFVEKVDKVIYDSKKYKYGDLLANISPVGESEVYGGYYVSFEKQYSFDYSSLLEWVGLVGNGFVKFLNYLFENWNYGTYFQRISNTLNFNLINTTVFVYNNNAQAFGEGVSVVGILDGNLKNKDITYTIKMPFKTGVGVFEKNEFLEHNIFIKNKHTNKIN
jgi:hypothetical protein